MSTESTAPATTETPAVAPAQDAGDDTAALQNFLKSNPLFGSGEKAAEPIATTEEVPAEVIASEVETENKPGEVVTDETIEVKTEEKKEEVDPKFASRFASLSRKEKMLAEKERTLKVEKQSLALYREAKELKEKGDIMGAAEKLGLTVDDFVNNLISKEKEETVVETKDAKYEELQRELQETKKLIQKQDLMLKQEKANAQISAFKKDIDSFINKDPVKYEICNSKDLTDQIFATVQNHYNKYKEILTIEEAADAVEAFYEDEFNQWTKITKLKNKFTTPEPKATGVEKKIEEKRSSRTITNKDASTSSLKSLDDMTEKEIEALALKKLMGDA